MSLQNPTSVVTEERLNQFYTDLLPYLGRSADAGFTPVGTIISVMGVTAPVNYLACNGQTVNIADYPELANYFKQQFGSANKFGGDGTTTFKIPDLRGEFLRGTGTNSHANQGSGSAVGTHQDATEFPKFGVTANAKRFFSVVENDTTKFNDILKADKELYISNNYVGLDSPGNTHTWENVPLKITTRPTNTSVLFCIATKNIYLNPSLDYSTDEKVVGTWIDGKTIYQRTFTGITPSTSRTNLELTTEGNYKAVIDYNGYIEANYGNVNIKFWDTVSGKSYGCTGAKVLDSTHQIVFSVIDADANSYLNKNFFITVQYTKTTS